MNAITTVSELEPGRWYAIGIEDDEGEIDWSAAALARYEGDGKWTDEDGEAVEWFYDRFLGARISTDAADAYLPQGGMVAS